MRDGGLSDELLLNRVVPENHAGTVAGMMNERGAYGDLFSLCCLYHQSNMGNLHSMLETSQKNSILHLFVMKQLVDEIKPLMRHLRASYLRVAERSSSLRGRITGNGMLQYASTGSTELECEFEEFTTNIPLYVSSLRHFQVQTIREQNLFTLELARKPNKSASNSTIFVPITSDKPFMLLVLRLNSLSDNDGGAPLGAFLSRSEKEWNSKHFKHEQLCLEHQHCDGNLGGNHLAGQAAVN